MGTADTTATVIEAAGRAGVAVLIWGGPGIGKTSLVESIARDLDVPFECVIGSIREPSDFAGLPVVGPDGVTLAPPAWAERLVAADSGVLLLDELTCCPPAVQSAMLRVVLDRYVGDTKLPESVRVIAAANPPAIAADGWDLPAPTASRFCHVNLDVDSKAWLDGMGTGFASRPASRAVEASPESRARASAMVRGFINARPAMLYNLPTEATAQGRAWPCPRTWTMLSEVLGYLHPDDEAAMLAAATGLVGEAAGAEFCSWARDADLPDPRTLLANPEAVLPYLDRPDRAWAALSGIVAAVRSDGTVDTWEKAWRVLAAVVKAGTKDVAAGVATDLYRVRPPKALPPKSAAVFTPALVEAGLLDPAA